jgi:hypothetical protein
VARAGRGSTPVLLVTAMPWSTFSVDKRVNILMISWEHNPCVSCYDSPGESSKSSLPNCEGQVSGLPARGGLKIQSHRHTKARMPLEVW